MDQIKSTSSTLKTLFGFLIPLPTLFLIFVWIVAAYQHCHILAVLFGFANESLTLWDSVEISINKVGILFFLIMTSIQTYLFWHLRKLFAAYSVGKIFTHRNSIALNRIALAFLELTLVSVLIITTCSLFLISKDISDLRSLLITSGILQGCNIAISITILVVSWVLEEGRQIKEEHEHTI
jgi:hypothetical protein